MSSEDSLNIELMSFGLKVANIGYTNGIVFLTFSLVSSLSLSPSFSLLHSSPSPFPYSLSLHLPPFLSTFFLSLSTSLPFSPPPSLSLSLHFLSLSLVLSHSLFLPFTLSFCCSPSPPPLLLLSPSFLLSLSPTVLFPTLPIAPFITLYMITNFVWGRLCINLQSFQHIIFFKVYIYVGGWLSCILCA